MGFIQGEGRNQGTLFPVTLDDLIPEDHVCRVIDAYAGRPEICGACPLKAQCTVRSRRLVKRHLHDAALQRMHARATQRSCGCVVLSWNIHLRPSNTTSSATLVFCCEV